MAIYGLISLSTMQRKIGISKSFQELNYISLKTHTRKFVSISISQYLRKTKQDWKTYTGWLPIQIWKVSTTSQGVISITSQWRTLPVIPTPISSGQYTFQAGVLGEKTYVALLGHTCKSDGANFSIRNVEEYVFGGIVTTVVNATPAGFAAAPDYDGFSIVLYPPNGSSFVRITFGDIAVGGSITTNVGSIVTGTYFDMPHSPDLSLTMSREYGGIKTIETKGGASLSNAMWTKPAMWGEYPAWELISPGSDHTIPKMGGVELSRSGRRAWDLSFSYLDDGDVFGSNQMIGLHTAIQLADAGYSADDIADSNSTVFDVNNNLLRHDNFFSQVIHKTNGGQLPFIFQPNKDDKTNFAICKFDMNSFKFSQVANGVYNIKLKIREVW